MCVCSMCLCKPCTLVDYVTHYESHAHVSRAITCIHPPSSVRFVTYASLRCHIVRQHRTRTSVTVAFPRIDVSDEVTLGCNVALYHLKCSIGAQMIEHLQAYINEGKVVICLYGGCDGTFRVKSTFSYHISRKHLLKVK